MIITYASHKGGCGKTTGAVNHVAWLLSQEKSVGLIDTDPNKHASKWAERRLENHPGLNPNVATLEAVAVTGDIKRVIQSMHNEYDFVVIDSAGVESNAGAMAIGLADLVMTPFIPSWMDLETATAVDTQIFQLKAKANPNLIACAYLSAVSTNSMTDERLMANQALKNILESTHVLNGYTKSRKAYRDSFSEGKGVVDWNDSKAKAEFQMLMQEVHSL